MSVARVLIVIVLCVVLLVQAQRSRGLRYRRWSMLLGAAAFGVLAIGNLLPLLGIDVSDYSVAVIGVPMLLLLASVVCFGLSWRAHERHDDVLQARRDLADEIKRRSNERDA